MFSIPLAKRLKAGIFFFICLAVLSIGSFALAQEKINSFNVQAQIQGNSSVLITEDIFYDFGTEYKHGIYRDIYSKDIAVDVKKVVDENGSKYKYKIINSKDNIRVKIGDANQTISGVHHYVISYLVKSAIKFLPYQDEFYWNLTGNNWTVPISKVGFSISFPQQLKAQDVKLQCYSGAFGSTKLEDCYFNSSDYKFSIDRNFNVGEGLTVVVGWSKGIVAPPGLLEKIGDFAKGFWPFTLPIIVFVCLFIVWWKKGKDIHLHKSIMAQYDLPNGLCPAEVGYILNQKTGIKDISATIVDLAVKGYLKIKETEKKNFIGKSKDWILIKQKEFSADEFLEPFESHLLGALFFGKNEVFISGLKEKFYKEANLFKEKIAKEMVLDDYFTANPSKTKGKYFFAGIVIMLVIFFVFRIFSVFIKQAWFLHFAIPIFICGALFFVFSFFMPKKTLKGTETLWHIKGFKEYITKAEKYRAQFQEKENIFEKFLPYAIIFGCTKKWAKAFEGIYKNPPTWYEGAVYGAYFRPVNFSKSFDSSMAAIGTALAARPGGGRGGSGFSGGGFGGGGGGSW